ncbi:MAG: ATP-grasp ribosomal peptide maturase, partial [Pseudonocardiaceae bacterium]
MALDEVKAIYYRRPGRFEFDIRIPLAMVPWCEGQARFGFWGVLESLPATWINPPSSVHQAEYKPRQLAHATAAGLTVPPTLVTNDPHAVADFAVKQPHGIVTKTLYARMPRAEDGRLSGVVYTSDVPPDRYRDPSITATAHLFQAKLAKIADLRVTVIGESVFATHIDNPGELDWRRSYDNITYRPYALPDTVLAGVRRLMRSLGLVFGALDFVLTDQGHQFIEINPNGQWGWIEHQTGQPISRAIAAALKGTPT